MSDSDSNLHSVTCTAMTIRIMLFEDNEKLRESLAFLMDGGQGFEVVGSYPDCDNAVELVARYMPHVVLMDIDMPGEGGIKGVELVKSVNAEIAVIMYTVFEDDDKLFRCLCSGANVYLLKRTPPGRLFEAIHEVMDGGAPMSPPIARKIIESFRQSVQPNQYQLTTRETEVLGLLVKGYSIKMIASDLHAAFDTIRSHLKNIYRKLHVNCGKEAIAKALKEKMV